jgi:hypothetical protein
MGGSAAFWRAGRLRAVLSCHSPVARIRLESSTALPMPRSNPRLAAQQRRSMLSSSRAALA